MKTKPKLASARDTLIHAVVAGAYRFEAQSDARAVLENITVQYLQSKERETDEATGLPVLRFWIRGYELTADEKAKGYRGNFARVQVVFLPSGQYTLKAQKLDVPLARHPQKDYARGYHPNRGNPVMRAVESGRVFSGMAEANALLEQMHIDYPKATIPGTNCLHIMLYTHSDTDNSPIEKITVKVRPLQAGGARLELQKKKPRFKTPLKGAVSAKSKPPAKAEGKFTAMLVARRSRKKT